MTQLLKDRAILSIKGKDSLLFLQNIVTNDLSGTLYSYNYLLSSHGRYLYDFFVLNLSSNDFLIDIDYASSHSFIKKLNLYKMRQNVEIRDLTDNYSILYSKEILDNSDKIISSNKDPRFIKLGFRSLVQSIHVEDLEIYSNNLYITDKYEYTIPDGINDLIFDTSLVSQFGAEELYALSFSKGCYIGQEVISRFKYQGSLRKKLFKISSNTRIPYHKIGTEITDFKGKKIGILCSSYIGSGIALLNYEKYLELDKKVAVINSTYQVLITPPEWRV